MMHKHIFLAAVLTMIIVTGCSDDPSGSSDSANERKQELSDGLDVETVIERAKQESADSKIVPAHKLLAVAIDRVHAEDPDAEIMQVKYSWGDRNLRFKSARFTFNSPALKAAGERKTSYRVKLRGTAVQDITPVASYWMDGAEVDVTPGKPLEAALAAGFDDWWEEHPNANLYMKLRPHSEYDKYKPKNSPWLWIITGSGPGLPEDYRAYVAPDTMEVLGTERKKVTVR